METNQITEKVYCYDHPAAYRNNDNGMCYAMMANQNNMNNPMWLVWMMAMRWMYGNGYGECGYGQKAELSALQGQISDNQSFNNLMNQLTQNQNLMQDFANRTNTSIDFVRQALCELKSAVQNVVGETKFSAERVINAVQSGDTQVIMALKDCCCQTKELVQRIGSENQLQNCQQTNTILTGINGVNTGLERGFSGIGNIINQGFSQIGYQSNTDKCDIINAINAAQQRTSDLLTGHWQSETERKLQDAKFEISQLKQNQYLAGLINGGGCCCTSNNTCC